MNKGGYRKYPRDGRWQQWIEIGSSDVELEEQVRNGDWWCSEETSLVSSWHLRWSYSHWNEKSASRTTSIFLTGKKWYLKFREVYKISLLLTI